MYASTAFLIWFRHGDVLSPLTRMFRIVHIFVAPSGLTPCWIVSLHCVIAFLFRAQHQNSTCFVSERVITAVDALLLYIHITEWLSIHCWNMIRHEKSFVAKCALSFNKEKKPQEIKLEAYSRGLSWVFFFKTLVVKCFICSAIFTILLMHMLHKLNLLLLFKQLHEMKGKIQQ